MRSTLKFSAKYAPLFEWPEGRRYALVTGGRGSGKSFALATALVAWMDREPGRKILYTRYTLASAKDSIIPEFEEKIGLLGLDGRFASTSNEIIHVNGSRILFRGIKTSEGVQTAKLKSIQGVNAWIVDEAEELPSEELFDKIDLSIRDGRASNRVVLCLNPSHKTHWIYRRWFEHGQLADTIHIHSDYRDNLRNLPPDYVAKAEECRRLNPRRHNGVWLGQWLEEMEGAICSYEMIRTAREPRKFPEFRRVVVAIDPAMTSTPEADETGIVAVGLGIDRRYYVLSDDTVRATPAGWAAAAISLFQRTRGDRIVAEVNNGGEMVEFTLRSISEDIPYQAVHATRGKLARAEPVRALYERGMVSHASGLQELEVELMTYAGRETDKSPNRLDALVWAVSALMDDPGVRDLEIF